MRTTAMQLLVVGIVVCGAPIAHAADDTELAKRLFEIGETLYGRSDYEGAIRNFREAHRLSKRPELLYNIARSHEALGQHQQAIDTYRHYLRTAQKDAYGVRDRIANLRKILDRQLAGERTEQERVAAQRREEQAKLSAERGKRESLERALREERVTRAGSPLPGWLTLGGGGALLIVGGVLVAVGKARQGEVEELASQGLEYASFKSKEESGRNLSRGGIALLAVGGSVAVVGGVLTFLHYRKSGQAERQAWLAPYATPAGGGVVFGGKLW